MIQNIENREIEVHIKNEKIELPDFIKDKINGFWNETKIKNQHLWNGKLMCVCSYETKEKKVSITCKETNYAHYLYDEKIGLPNEYGCYSLGAGCLIETNDNYYVLGELNKNTSFPYCIQPCGGGAEKQDLENSGIIQTIIREMKEELNINLEDKNKVLENEIKYISLPENRLHTYMIFTKCLLKMNKEELEKHYKNYLQELKTNQEEVEFSKLHFIKKDNITDYLQKTMKPKREYLEELLEYDSSNKKK